jgi:predicted acylesterase/phospholipase RssA
MDNDNPYRGLCLSSGGIKGVCQLGALAIFEMKGYLKFINRFSGCSIGSIITLLLACGWKPIELYRRAVKVKLFNGMSDINIETFKTKHGLISNDMLRQELETLVIEKRGKLPTMLDFHNEGIYLSFSICDRRTKTGKKLDWQSHPLLLATEGALMSSNMPVIFPPMEFDGMKVTDGALSNPFPIDYLDNNRDRILGIAVYGDSAEDSLSNTISDTIMIPIEEIQRRITANASNKVDILEMTVLDISVMDINASFDAKDDMFFAGLENAKVMIRVLDKKKRLEHKHQKRSMRQNINKPVGGKSIDGGNKETETASKRRSNRRTPNNMVRLPLKAIPEEVLVKCLLSQPIDILLLAAINHRETLKSAIKHLSPAKFNQLRHFSRQVNDDPVKYSRRRPGSNHSETMPSDENKPVSQQGESKNTGSGNDNNKDSGKYGESYKVKIEENHSQKIYDNLPAHMQSMAKSVFGALSEEQAQKTISGINIVVEGLNRLGINIFNGLLLQGSPTVEESDSSSPRDVIHNRVEVIVEEDFGRNVDGSVKLASDGVD